MPNRLVPKAASSFHDAADVRTLVDIGDVSARWLAAIGITTVGELRRVGAAEAYARIAYRFRGAANRNLLYALAMGLEGRKYNDVSDAEKRALCKAAGIAPPTRHRQTASRVRRTR